MKNLRNMRRLRDDEVSEVEGSSCRSGCMTSPVIAAVNYLDPVELVKPDIQHSW